MIKVNRIRLGKLISIVSVAAIVAGMTGCESFPSMSNNFTSDCHLSDQYILDKAIADTQKKLQTDACQTQYYTYYDKLIDIAAEDPGFHNYEKIKTFSKWSVSQGLVSNRQAKEHLFRYFKPQFVSITMDKHYELYNICSFEVKKESIYREMKNELAQKKKGIFSALGDVKQYSKVRNLYENAVYSLETDFMACKGNG